MDKSEKTPAEGSPDRYCVLVVGMHRSGTSALTRMFSLLGCDLPKTLLPASRNDNDLGFWESQPIMELNNRILESAGTSWDDWQAINPGWFRSPRAAQFRDEALALLREEFGESRLFVFKDPRLCRLAPFWLDVLEAAGVRPLVVTPVRNPLEVASSLERRGGHDPSFSLLMWLRHVLDAEAATRGLPRFFASYDRLLAGWAGLAADAAKTLGMDWPRQSARAAIEIETFLNDGLRHHRETAEAIVDNPMHAAWVRDAFRTFAGWAESGEREKDRAALDRIREEFDSAALAFARPLEAGYRAVRKTQRLQRDMEALRQRVTDAEARARDAEAARKALAEARDRLSQFESELAQRRHEAEEMRAAAEKAQADRRHLQERLDAQIEETAKLTRMLRERDEEAVRARTRSDELAERLREKEAAAARAEGELARARREAEAAAAEKRDLSARLDARFGEIATLTRMLREREDAAAMLDRAVEKAMNGAEWGFLPARLRLWRRMQALRASGLFDAEWYVARYGDVAADATARRDPLRHFAAHGWAEGRAPNAALAAWKGEE
ncbi:MAG: sulfotransferase [Amphiplicatus sp.]